MTATTATGRRVRRAPGRLSNESLETVRAEALRELAELQKLVEAVDKNTTDFQPYYEAAYAAARLGHRIKHIGRKIRLKQWY